MIALNFKVFGEGKPVIIVHGLFGMLDNWQSIARKLSDQYKVFIIDQRDHGKSPFTTEFNYDLLAEDLLHFIDQHNLEKPCLIGHSMGGKTVMNFSMLWPHLVDKIIIVDIAPKPYKGGHEGIFEAIFTAEVETATTRDEVYEHLLARLNDEVTVNFLMKNLSRSDEGGFEWKANFKNLNKHYDEIIGDLPHKDICEIPALFIRGSRSNYVLDDDWVTISELFPMAKLETIKDAGHWVHAEQPERLLEVVLDFVKVDENKRQL